MGYNLYAYSPSVACAAIATVLFFVLTISHLWLLVRNGTYFFSAFVVGVEVVGYIARAVSAHQDPDYTVMPYALQSLFILLAPSLFAASIYMILGRIIRLTEGDSRSIIRAKFMTKIFVLGDVLSFLIQSGGGGIMSTSKSQSQMKLGENMIIVGLVVQVLFFGFFAVVAIIFHKRISAHPTTNSLGLSVPWKKFLFVLYAASGLILIRCLYRIIEYAQGSSGTLQSREAYAYIFDGMLMLGMMLLFIIFHPHQILGGAQGSLKMEYSMSSRLV
ncbi:RTA1 like protein [Penicillium canescens]|uniref:RTA1 like protein n=1 Tax=Penicillium canescens TaxID=5083 RepID=A0AAD6N6M2_PENCN|nr:RTA1 like protein [Penicillium canescens]KAJ6037698.1 RTA1 like protein [Penicillium canescens]KAJ6098326.1 RTA1 like protein [Penicillium canescens]KAJ6166315.1 RTA1 like protein [Penicillium canescens]